MENNNIKNNKNYLGVILVVSIVLLSFSGCKQYEEVNSNSKPNIIYILADDLGYGDLGCYGQEEIKTPNLDKMADEGMLFTDHYAGSTVCAPSRASLMTGMHTGHAQIRGNSEVRPMGQKPLNEGTVTIAREMQKAGYKTGLIGKWGLGGPNSSGIPTNQGFDYFFGYLCQRHAHNYYPEFLFRNHERVKLNNIVDNDRLDGAGQAKIKNEYAHSRIADEALKFIENNKDNKFFLVHTPTIPHANNEADKNGMEIPSYGIYSDKDWPDPQKGHAAMITQLDSDIGRILTLLEELNISENTLVIFTSDNGPHKEGGADPEFFNSNGALRGMKRDLYEGGIRVPMIARWPGKVKAGTKTNHISAFWDVFPTVCELVNIKSPQTDGISFLPTLLNEKQIHHEFLYWEFHGVGDMQQAVRMGKWKAVRHSPSEDIKLFDLENDLREEKDIASNNPKMVEKITAILTESRSKNEFWGN